MTTQAKTIEQLQADERAAHAEYEKKIVGMEDEDGTTYTIASLRAAFDRYFPGDDWKRPVDVTLPWESEGLVCFCRAIEFFQGDRPKVKNVTGAKFGSVRITSRGYQG